MTTDEVLQALREVCPVRFVEDTGQGAWRYGVEPTATVEQIAAAAARMAEINADAPPVPRSVKMWQAKAALSLSGKLADADTAIAQVSRPELTIAWEYATDVSRDSPGMSAIGQAIGLDAAAIDNLFIAAAQIKV